MERWGWKLVVMGWTLLCGGCVEPSGVVPLRLAAMPVATPLPMATTVLTASAGQPCSLTEPSSSLHCDKEVLLASRDALRGTSTDEFLTWQRRNPIESFEGVRVNPSSGRVVALETVWPTSLTGIIPPALGLLSQLQVLDLGLNRLTGSIPSALGQLSQLQVLNLSRSGLTGPIPPELGQLSQLQSLLLSGNLLTGPIPPELGLLCHLQVLDLGLNRLTGPIPPELGRLGRLHELHLLHNRLEGSIPPELGRLSQLQVLDLTDNWLTGPIPSELGQLGQLKTLLLSGNGLTGTFPSALGQLSQLEILDLRHTRLTGSIPTTLGQPIPQQVLDFTHHYRLLGSISSEPGPLYHLGIPPAIGVYTDQAEHWGGRFHVRRQGSRVTATLATHRSPVGHETRLQALFRLPEGYRPILPVTWTAAARPMTTQGRPRSEVPAVTVILEARPDGLVHHLDGPTLDGADYVGYHTTMTWTTDETALLMAGAFIPAAGTGTYRLVRLGDTVTATLVFPVKGRSGARPAPLLFTVPAGFRPVTETTWTSPTPGPAGGAVDLRVHRDGAVMQAGLPGPAGYVATVMWRTLDPGWMEIRGFFAPAAGEGTGTYTLRRDGEQVTATVTGEHGVPSTSVLFTVPEGFRPARTVDAVGCRAPSLQVRPEGTVHFVRGQFGTGNKPLVYETTMTWTAGADVCRRHDWVQAILLQALRSQDRVRDSYAEVTWTDLAAVKSLHLNPGSGIPTAATHHPWIEDASPLQVHDLAGLTGLTTLGLQGEGWSPVPTDLLTHVPALESLHLSTPSLRLPPDFLAHVPELRALTLETAGLTELLPDLLVHVPKLRSLTLKVPHLTELPVDLLVHVPELQSLTLEAAELTELPPGLLVHISKLHSLILKVPHLTELPMDLLIHVPELRCLFVEATNVTADFRARQREINTRCHLLLGRG